MAVVHRALRLQGHDRLCVGLIALFPLASSPHLDALRPETELWQRLPQAPGAPAVLDEGYPKPQAEFLLYGEACAPGGKAVAELAVRARVGGLDKPLIVHGDRRWNALGTMSSAAPFTRMPIVPAAAFGGPGDAVNPLGRAAPALPNVEDPRQPITFKDDHPAARRSANAIWARSASRGCRRPGRICPKTRRAATSRARRRTSERPAFSPATRPSS
jgi:hypothetical protein